MKRIKKRGYRVSQVPTLNDANNENSLNRREFGFGRLFRKLRGLYDDVMRLEKAYDVMNSLQRTLPTRSTSLYFRKTGIPFPSARYQLLQSA